MSETAPTEDPQEVLARQRTQSALQRTFLAEQRTYSAWIRTGLASAVTGFAVAKFMADTGPRALVLALAALFCAAGAAMFLLAFWAYKNAVARMEQTGAGGIPLWVLGLISVALFVAVGAGLLLILQG